MATRGRCTPRLYLGTILVLNLCKRSTAHVISVGDDIATMFTLYLLYSFLNCKRVSRREGVLSLSELSGWRVIVEQLSSE